MKRKVILMGEVSVGKTSIYASIIRSKFPMEYRATLNLTTTELSFSSQKDNQKIRYYFVSILLKQYDTPGQDSFDSLITSYYRDSEIILLVFDVRDPSTLAAACSRAQRILE